MLQENYKVQTEHCQAHRKVLSSVVVDVLVRADDDDYRKMKKQRLKKVDCSRLKCRVGFLVCALLRKLLRHYMYHYPYAFVDLWTEVRDWSLTPV